MRRRIGVVVFDYVSNVCVLFNYEIGIDLDVGGFGLVDYWFLVFMRMEFRDVLDVIIVIVKILDKKDDFFKEI